MVVCVCVDVGVGVVFICGLLLEAIFIKTLYFMQ